MPRERLKPGEWGEITETTRGSKIVAKARIRDLDGVKRLVERVGTSKEDARRKLVAELKNRTRVRESGGLKNTSKVRELAEYWLAKRAAEVAAGSLSGQSYGGYKDAWKRIAKERLGELEIRDVTTGVADAFLTNTKSPSNAQLARVVCGGMFATAVRLDLIDVNPFNGTATVKVKKKPVRDVKPLELDEVRTLIADYCRHEYTTADGIVKRKLGPAPGQDLPDIVELLVCTGARISEVLALRRNADFDLDGDEPTVTFNGTLVVPRFKGEKLYRQEYRKGDAPPLTVVLPLWIVPRLRQRLENGHSDDDYIEVDRDGMTIRKYINPHDAFFVTGTGNWVSPANIRRNLRAALRLDDVDLDWLTPHSFRRTVATAVKDEHGLDAAAAQLGNTTRVTEQHYVARGTKAPDRTDVLNSFAPKVDPIG